MYAERVRSDRARRMICLYSGERLKTALNGELPYLVVPVVAQLEQVAPAFLAALDEATSLRGKYKTIARLRDQALEDLKAHVRGARGVLDSRVLRNHLSKLTVRPYRVSRVSSWQQPTTIKGWFACGRQMVKGDAQAVADGQQPLCEPTAAKVEEVLQRAVALEKELNVLGLRQTMAGHALKKTRSTLDPIICKLRNRLVEEGREIGGASWRTLLTMAGFTIRYHKTSKLEPSQAAETPASASQPPMTPPAPLEQEQAELLAGEAIRPELLPVPLKPAKQKAEGTGKRGLAALWQTMISVTERAMGRRDFPSKTPEQQLEKKDDPPF